MKDKRFYSFMVVIYPDDPKFKTQLESLCKYDYIYIMHDKDLKEDSTEFKKIHYHVIVKFKNARTISALAKESELSENMIEPIKSLTASLKYLLHYKNDNKHQYDIKDVVSNCKLLSRLETLVFEDKPESDIARDIASYIIDYPGVLSFEQLYFHVCTPELYPIFRRDNSSFRYLLERHNELMRKDGYI